MMVASPRNPNVCLGCEQLLDDMDHGRDGGLRKTALNQAVQAAEPEAPCFHVLN
jgi:hypothetical protein